MFNSGILDVVIGLIVIYLELSLVCTAVNEIIASVLKKRAKELERGIAKLLTSPQLVAKFYAHPLIQGLRPDGKTPSYIPSQTFALTIMDIVRRNSFDGTLASALQTVQNSETAQTTAQSTFQTADAALSSAQAVRVAAEAALTSAAGASADDRLTATKTVQETLNNQAAAVAARTDALTKHQAALQSLADALNYQTQLVSTVSDARQSEVTAAQAEKLLARDPTKQALKDAAKRARDEANAIAASITPSTASLLTEARDKVVGVPDAVVPAELKSALLALLDNAGSNLTKAQTNLEQWFNDAMDRVSGVYKQKSQTWVVCIALVVTVLANVDSLQIADTLSHDKAVRESLVAAAPELAKADKEAVERERAANQPNSNTTVPANPNSSPNPTSAEPSATPSLNAIRASLAQLKSLGAPIGYIRVCTAMEEKIVDTCPNPFAKLIDAETKLATAKTNVENENKALESATEKAAAQAALTKAQAALDAAQKAQVKAEAEARQANPDLLGLRNEVRKAEEAANAQALEDAQIKFANASEEQRGKCPSCAKQARLSPNELKQRLPTTHDYKFFNKDTLLEIIFSRPVLSPDYKAATLALAGDVWNLVYSHWLGWLLTTLAISLGAPFWFDTLNRLMVVRSTIKPQEKSQTQKSKDNPEDSETETRKKDS